MGGFMKKIVLFANAVLFLLLSQATFAAENTGFYIGVSGGYVIPQTMTLYDPDSGSEIMDTTLKNGYLGGVKAGWNTPFTNRILAVELEYNYIFGTDFDNNKIYDNIPDISVPVYIDGTIKIQDILLNFKARYPEGRFHPYVGFGVGYAYFQVGDATVTLADGSMSAVVGTSASGGAFCYQFLAGLDFDITPNFGVGIGYKYLASKPTIGSTGTGEFYQDIDYKTSVVTLGLNYTF